MNIPSPCLAPARGTAAALILSMACGAAGLLPAQTETPEVVTLSPFQVNTEKDVGYYSGNSISATKTNVPLQNLPMSLQVMTRTFLDDVNASDIESAMVYAAAVNPATNEPGRFTLRGFVNPNPMRNGIDTLSETNFVSALTLDRVEIVKGPAAILYGITEPGGLINMITKKPLFKTQGEVRMQAGDYSTLGGDLDATGALVGDKVAYRLIAGYSETGYEVDYAFDETLTIAPSVLFQLTPRSSLLLAYEYQDLKSVPDGGAILKLSDAGARIGFVQGNYYSVPKTFNHQGPFARKDTETSYYSADFQHTFADERFALRAVVNKTNTFLDQDTRLGAGEELKGSDGQYGWVRTHILARLVERDETVFQGEFTGRLDLGGVTHRVLFGYEKTTYEQDQKAFRQNNALPLMNLKNPAVWNFTIPTAPANRPLRPTDFFTDQETWSLYAVHQGEFLDGKLHSLLGLRHDVVESATLNRLVTPATSSTVPTTRNWTPQFGLLYAVTPSVGIYGAYSESFTPNTSVNPDGTMFDPATGEGVDFGLKFNAKDGRFNATFSLFDIRKVGIVRQDVDRRNNDPAGGLWFKASGEERSRGGEVDIVMTPVPAYQTTISYAYIDAYVVANADAPAEEGNQLGETPTHNFAWWNKYSFTGGALNGFFVGAGVNSRSKSKLDSQVVNLTVSYPSYTALDLVLGYQRQSGRFPWELTVRVNNATDERYFARNRAYADGRNFQFTAKIRY